jgi:F-type H+-transporting ATPase subunit b
MEQLGINLGFFLAQVINFLLVFGLLTYFAWGPLMRFLDRRREEIAKGLEDARVAAEARANAEAEAGRILAEAQKEAQKIIADARASAEERARPVIQAAEKDAEQIRNNARTQAEQAVTSALSEVRGQVIALAMAATHKLIGDSMSKEQQEKVINSFFTTAGDKLKGLSGDLVVTTALTLTDAEKKSLEAQLGGKVSDWRVDPSILGGVVVRAGDKVVDGSVRSSLGSLAGSLN